MSEYDFCDSYDIFQEKMEVSASSKRFFLPYIGSKRKIADKIIPHLPLKEKYVEPFCGAAGVLLEMKPVPYEVINDRNRGVTSFFRALREEPDRLLTRLNDTIFSREEFEWARDTWDKDILDDVERGARWYYTIMLSFTGRGEAFTTSTKHNKIQYYYKSIPLLEHLHARLRNVIIENRDWKKLVVEWNTPDTLFYLDPPYVDTTWTYGEFTTQDARDLVDFIENCEGAVALSGYSHPIYEAIDWDERIVIPTISSITGHGEKTIKEEVLWVRN